MSTKKPTKQAVLKPALSPFNVEMSEEAQQHLRGSIHEITVNFLAKGIRVVAVPSGQANAVKAAFEAATDHDGTTRERPGPMRRWRVEITKVSGILAELKFHTSDDPVADFPASTLLPIVDELLKWAREHDGTDVRWDDASPLGQILGRLRVARAMVDA